MKGFLAFRNEFIRQADCLGNWKPSGLDFLEVFDHPRVFLVELVNRMIAMILRIAFPTSRWSKGPEPLPFHLKHQQAMGGIENKEIPLPPHTIIVDVVEPPTHDPSPAQTLEVVGDFELMLIAAIGGAIVKPASHGATFIPDTDDQGKGSSLLKGKIPTNFPNLHPQPFLRNTNLPVNQSRQAAGDTCRGAGVIA